MRVFVIIYEFPPVGGGGGRVAEDICRGLVMQGHQVFILTSHYKGLPYRETQDGFEIWRVPAMRRAAFKARFMDMLGYVFSGFWAGLLTILRWKPDVMHVHFAVPSGAVAWPLAVLTGIPYVLTAHLGDVPGGVPDKTTKWFRWVFPLTPPIWKRAAHICGVSAFTQALAKKSYDVDVQVIPNGVDLTLLDPGEISVGAPPRILFAGRFVTQKNPLQIVRALAALDELPWECVMVGDGTLRAEVETEIEHLGLSNRFTLTGWVTPAEVIEWFSKSDILFMPSLSEGLPVVGVQALAMGLAIVASRVGGFIDLVVPGENGYLLDARDETAGVAELRKLLSSPERLQAYRESSRRLAARFDIRGIVQAYEKAMLDAIRAGRTPEGES